MELDIIGILIGAGIGIVLGCIIGFIFASFSNILWKAKFMRNNMKKEVFVFRILNKDKHNMKEMLVDVNDDIKIMGDKAFICEKGRVWRTSVENMKLFEGSKRKQEAPKQMDEMATLESGDVPVQQINRDDGFYLEQPQNSKKVMWEQEVPVLHIDEESFRPIEFPEAKSESNVTAAQMADMIVTHINVQVARKLAKKTQDIMLILVLAGFAISIFLVFSLTGKVEDLGKDIDAISGRLTTIEGNMEGGSQDGVNPIIIKQMPMEDNYGVLSTTA